MTRENYLKMTDIVGALIHGEKVRGYSFLTLMDIRDLYDIYLRINEGPTFINGNVKKALDKLGVKTIPCGNGWKVSDWVE